MVETPNNICPVCGYDDISYDSSIEPDDDIWRQRCSCPKCKSRWYNIYQMVEDGYADVEPDENTYMKCPSCKKPIDHVEIHASFDKKVKLTPPEEDFLPWKAVISEEDEKENYEVEVVTCPKCLATIPFNGGEYGSIEVEIKDE